MANTFKIAAGHDIALVSLVDFTPYQPSTPELQHTRHVYAADGNVDAQGPFIEFTWPILSEAEYQALLIQCGLTGVVRTADVTIYAQDLNYAWRRYNGVAVRAEFLRRHSFFFYDVPILVKQLDPLTEPP